MSSCKRATYATVRPKPKDSAATMNNPINSHPGKMCSCGKMCKNNRGLKIDQEKSKCQTPKNELITPPRKCFVSLQNVILSSCFLFDDSVSIVEHLTTPLFPSQIVRRQLLVTCAMYKQKTSLSIF